MTDTVLARSVSILALSDDQAARARKNLSAILNGLGRVGQVHVAEAVGVHESTISKMKEADLERFAQILSVVGLQVVDCSLRIYPQDEIEALLVLARKRLSALESTKLAGWE